MYTRLSFATILILSSLLATEGCNTPVPKRFSSELVRVYAELLALNEKEKISANTPDSLYRLKVKELFEARKIDEEDFQKEIRDISRDDAAWRDFLIKTTAALDSIRAARAVHH
ncbi:MAG: hypothetical protein WBZ48_05435 [Bacteroidota bacterium]